MQQRYFENFHYEVHICKWMDTRRLVRCAWEDLPLSVDLLVMEIMVSSEYFQLESKFMFTDKF